MSKGRRVVLALLLAVGLAVVPRPAPAADEVGLPVVLGIVQREFAARTPPDPLTLLDGALARASEAVPALLYRLEGQPPTTLLLRMGLARAEVPLNGVDSLKRLLPVLERVEAFIRSNLRESLADPPAVPLIAGLLERLDSHSGLLRADGFGDFQSLATGHYGGVGVILGRQAGQLVVRSILADSAAHRAGLRRGDRLMRVDGHPVADLAVEAAEQLIHGPVGSRVKVEVQRGNEGLRRFMLQREEVRIPSVDSHLFEANGERIGYLRILSFQESTTDEMREHLRQFRPERPDLLGVILDLQGNPGGLLEQSMRVADVFLDRGTIAVTEGRRLPAKPVQARWYRSLPHLPLVVLVDGGTASAAELLAGALRNNRRAVLVGRPTHGKDSIQSIFPLTPNRALKLTVAHFLPGGEAFPPGGHIAPHVLTLPVRIPEQGSSSGLALAVAGVPATLRDRQEGGDEVVVRVPYLESRDDPDVLESVPLPPLGTLRERLLAADYPLGLARRLLRFPQERDFPVLLHTARRLGRAEARAQHLRIAERLAELGVDWRSASGQEQGALELLQVQVHQRSNPDAPWQVPVEGLRAGNEARLRLTVRNAGPAPATQAYTVAHSAAPAFDGLEVPLGYLPVGASRQGEVTLALPADLPMGQEAIALSLHRGNGEAGSETTVYLPLAADNTARRTNPGGDPVLHVAAPDVWQGGELVMLRGDLERGTEGHLVVRVNGRKLHHLAAPAAHPLAFALAMPLQPGRNELEVTLIRDGLHEASRRYVVFRGEPAGFPLDGLGPSH